MGFFVVFKAITTRVVFSIHGFIAIWRLTAVKEDPFWWILTSAMGSLFFESIFTIACRRGKEWKWFCPSVLCYLGCTVPAIWLLELDRLDKRLNGTTTTNDSKAEIDVTTDKANSTNLEILPTIPGVNIAIPIQLSNDHWILAVEQLLLFILILGRWMLPKGDLSRDELSQLLLVYIGTAADIIEFFEAFKEPKVKTNKLLIIIIMSMWSWSLLQFTFVLTATKGRKPRTGTVTKRDTPAADATCRQTCCTTDVAGVLISLFFQDVPFLGLRLCLIFKYEVVSYMNIFFTSKNTLVIILQCYRIFVLNFEKKKPPKKSKVIQQRMLRDKRVHNYQPHSAVNSVSGDSTQF